MARTLRVGFDKSVSEVGANCVRLVVLESEDTFDDRELRGRGI